MRRLYFLVPDVKHTRIIVDELLLARLSIDHLHVIAKEGTEISDLPEASLAQRSDVIPALQKGMATGGLAGLTAGILAMVFPIAGLPLGGGAVLALSLAGVCFGAVMSTMIGVSVPSTRVKRFEKAIKKGKLLLMIDVPKDREDEIEELVHSHHPEALVKGSEPNIPAFP